MSRSGFVALAGRPNAGKSTLLNRIVGGKVAIVSDKPQTTRRAIRGIATAADWQLVIVDLPGMQKPRDLLTERMQSQVERELKEADAVLFMLNGEQEIGAGDRFIAEAITRAGIPAVTVLNKVDLLKPHQIAEALAQVQKLGVDGRGLPGERRDWACTCPRSSKRSSASCRRGRSCTRPSSAPTSRSTCAWPS